MKAAPGIGDTISEGSAMEATTTFTHEYLDAQHLGFSSWAAYRVLVPEPGEVLSDWEDVMVRPAIPKGSVRQGAEEAALYRTLTTTVDVYVPEAPLDPPEDWVLVPRTLSVLAPHPFTYGQALEQVAAVLVAAGMTVEEIVDDRDGSLFFE